MLSSIQSTCVYDPTPYIVCLQFGMMETIVVGMSDRFPDTVGQHRVKFVLVCCVIGFLLGLPLATKVRFAYQHTRLCYDLTFNENILFLK